jgi:hypothetical protein
MMMIIAATRWRSYSLMDKNIKRSPNTKNEKFFSSTKNFLHKKTSSRERENKVREI